MLTRNFSLNRIQRSLFDNLWSFYTRCYLVWRLSLFSLLVSFLFDSILWSFAQNRAGPKVDLSREKAHAYNQKTYAFWKHSGSLLDQNLAKSRRFYESWLWSLRWRQYCILWRMQNSRVRWRNIENLMSLR